MTPTDPVEAKWTVWFDLQRSATEAWSSGNLMEAITLLDEFVASKPLRAIARQAIGFRGVLRDESGDLRAAREDFLAARQLTEGRDFEQYTLEESAAYISKKLGEVAEAERWYLEGLQTAAADPRTSGAGCLLQLLKLRGKRGLHPEEKALVKRVVYQAWHLLRVEGKPDLENLEKTAIKLIEAQARPFSVERPPAPKVYSEPAGGS